MEWEDCTDEQLQYWLEIYKDRFELGQRVADDYSRSAAEIERELEKRAGSTTQR